MQVKKKIINGREFEYLDVIHHHVETHFDFWDRIKILFHGKCRSSSEIYTKEFCHVQGSEAIVRVPPLIRRKPRTVGMMHSPEQQKTTTDAVQP
jgi:hypothetical protein